MVVHSRSLSCIRTPQSATSDHLTPSLYRRLQSLDRLADTNQGILVEFTLHVLSKRCASLNCFPFITLLLGSLDHSVSSILHRVRFHTAGAQRAAQRSKCRAHRLIHAVAVCRRDWMRPCPIRVSPAPGQNHVNIVLEEITQLVLESFVEALASRRHLNAEAQGVTQK